MGLRQLVRIEWLLYSDSLNGSSHRGITGGKDLASRVRCIHGWHGIVLNRVSSVFSPYCCLLEQAVINIGFGYPTLIQ
jgi:hypothetical protein